jgi:DNA polymerase epsilon subunit 2
LEFVETILKENEIEEAELESSLETLAKEYNKQDGTLFSSIRRISTHLQFVIDALMKVSVDVLKRVYETLQDQGERTQIEKELIDPDKHLFFIDTFDMPRWTWSSERGTFEKFLGFTRIIIPFLTPCFRSLTPCTWSGTPESRVTSIRDRLNIIRQCVLRNEHFAPSTLPSRDREKLVTVCSLNFVVE